MRRLTWRASLLLIAFSGGAAGAAEPDSISIQDLKPECRERHPSVAVEQCVIEDRLSRPDYVRRYGAGTIVIIESAPPPGAGGKPPSPAENVNRPPR